MGHSSEHAVRCVRLAIERASTGLVDREQLVELIVLAAVAREHVLIVGPPGTAKSQVVRRVAEHLHGKYFEYLIGRFTEPTDIFGTIDLARLREGHVEILTRGMLPEAEIAFLDEVFLGSPAILNTLLGLLNERIFVRGHTRLDCPLRLCVGASNEIPDEPMLAAFADRFLVRVFVQPLADELLETLLDAGWHDEGRAELRRAHSGTSATVTVNLLDELASLAERMDLTGIRPKIAEAVRTLRKAGIRLTDRRVVRLQRLIAAAAAVRGAAAPEAADLWPIIYAIPTAEEQSLGRDVLRELLDTASNETLPNAAEIASGSSSSRALRLCRQVDELLATERGAEFALRATAILREMTASFGNERLPEALASAKTRLLSEMQKAPSSAAPFAQVPQSDA
ncbi:MAG: AAA family ATPase [Polyangiaceae bacterium]